MRRYWAADGIHPSDEGYRVWGEYIAQNIVRQAPLMAHFHRAGAGGGSTPARAPLTTAHE